MVIHPQPIFIPIWAEAFPKIAQSARNHQPNQPDRTFSLSFSSVSFIPSLFYAICVCIS